ncbi:MAG: alpha/beta fold hydrolase [Ignavibacteria bacterium]
MKEYKVILETGIEISCFDKGISDKTVLCIHGLGSNKKAFLKNIDELSQNKRVIAIDLPSYGTSSKGDFPSTMMFFSAVIKKFIEAMDLKNVIVCGHSMGGQISILTAINYPDLIDKLILIAPAGLEIFTPDEIKRNQSYFTLDAIKNMTPAQIEFNVRLNFYNFPKEAQFMIDERIELSKSADFDFYCLTVSSAFQDMLKKPVYNFLHLIKQPVLLFFGKEDAFFPNKILHPTTTEFLAKEASKKIKNCRLVLIENCGHFLQFEMADTFNKEVIKFLN